MESLSLNDNSNSSSKEEEPIELSLSELIQRGLLNFDLILKSEEINSLKIQKLINFTISDLNLSLKLILNFSILSKNEIYKELNLKELKCLLINFLLAQLILLLKILPLNNLEQRILNLNKAKIHHKDYIKLINQYEIIPREQLNSYIGPTLELREPTKRRELKIQQFKLEREIKSKLDELRKRRIDKLPKASTSTTTIDPSDYDLNSDDDDDEDDYSKPLMLSLIKLNYLTSHTELNSIEQELELLLANLNHRDNTNVASGSGSSTMGRIEGGRERSRENEDSTSWKVEELKWGKGEGPLLDLEGKVLRSFTILPSSTNTSSPLSTRLRLQSEVFRSSHRLPTMTIDEFLEQEEASGRILQGGGPNGSEALETERRNKVAEDEDDTIYGFEREESGLRKKRDEDDWKDVNRKGAGNMHNRG